MLAKQQSRIEKRAARRVEHGVARVHYARVRLHEGVDLEDEVEVEGLGQVLLIQAAHLLEAPQLAHSEHLPREMM